MKRIAASIMLVGILGMVGNQSSAQSVQEIGQYRNLGQSLTTGISDMLLHCDNSTPIGQLRVQAIKADKILNVDNYEVRRKNAKTIQDVVCIEAEMQKYAMHTAIDYISARNISLNDSVLSSSILSTTTPIVGDVRIRTSTYYAAQTSYSQKSAQTLNSLVNSSLSIAVGWAHSALGVFMSVLQMIVPPYDYSTYTGIIERTLYDYKITQTIIDVYKYDGISKYYWAPMVTSEKRYTYGQINTVYYKKSVRYTPTNFDAGLVKLETGLFYNDTAKMIQMAKSALSPYFYAYNSGTSVNYNNDSRFTY